MATVPEPAPEGQPVVRPKPSLLGRIRKLSVRVWRRLVSFWHDIRPGPEAARGIIWGSFAAAAFWTVAFAVAVRTGLGVIPDVLLAFVLAALIVAASALLVWLLMTAARRLPRWTIGFLIGSVAVYIASAGPDFGTLIGLIIVLATATLGATVATFLFGFRDARLSKRIVTTVLFAISLAAVAGLVVFAATDGTTEVLTKPATAQNTPAPIQAPNPGLPGALPVKTLTYGSGNDRWRPEYRNVAIKTATVDASGFFKEYKGWRATVRRWYWGFGMDKLPLNARVWYPDGPGPFPLVLIVHGNHQMEQWSDPGYEYLGKLLASRGFILASIDENFLNGTWSGNPPDEKAPRGWMLLEHLRVWRDWNGKAGNPFFGKVDLNNIALMGHSRGGEAAATAALFNTLSYYPDDATIRFPAYGFNIRSVVAIAPADGQYKPAGAPRQIEDVNYFVLQGGHDADVSIFAGSKQFDRVKFTTPGPWFKSELYIYRANHGQFNSVWGRYDSGDDPFRWFLNVKPLLPPEDQRRIAAVYISAFLEATIRNRREYMPLFRDVRTGRAWLPDALCLNRYEDATWTLVADYAEDADVTTATLPGARISAENFSVWKEGRIPFRDGDRERNGVFLGWNRKTEKPVPVPVYAVTLPEGTPVGDHSVLALALSATDDKPEVPKGAKERKDKDDKGSKKDPEPVNFTVELSDAAGRTAAFPLTRFGVLQPPLKTRFTKWAFLDEKGYKKAAEPVLQTIELPLRDFAAAARGFDPAKLKTIRLRFDRVEKGSIVISEIGFRQDRMVY
jgi:dienelactone hydrolase